MSQRAIVAAELQHLLEQLQLAILNAERLAASSGLVNPQHFRAMLASVSLAAGDLDEKGLLLKAAPPALEREVQP